MLGIAEVLGEDTDFVRVDLYDLGGRIVFGELTSYPYGGVDEFRPASFDRVLGDVTPRVRMIEPELVPVVVEAPLVKQLPRPCVVQPRIVQHDQPGPGGEVGPHVIVKHGVAEMIDDEIVGRAAVAPDEVVRERLGKAVDLELALQLRKDLDAQRGDAGTDGRQRREPRDAQTVRWSLITAHWSPLIDDSRRSC